jgi:hypothetical protein
VLECCSWRWCNKQAAGCATDVAAVVALACYSHSITSKFLVIMAQAARTVLGRAAGLRRSSAAGEGDPWPSIPFDDKHRCFPQRPAAPFAKAKFHLALSCTAAWFQMLALEIIAWKSLVSEVAIPIPPPPGRLTRPVSVDYRSHIRHAAHDSFDCMGEGRGSRRP